MNEEKEKSYKYEFYTAFYVLIAFFGYVIFLCGGAYFNKNKQCTTLDKNGECVAWIKKVGK